MQCASKLPSMNLAEMISSSAFKALVSMLITKYLEIVLSTSKWKSSLFINSGWLYSSWRRDNLWGVPASHSEDQFYVYHLSSLSALSGHLSTYHYLLSRISMAILKYSQNCLLNNKLTYIAFYVKVGRRMFEVYCDMLSNFTRFSLVAYYYYILKSFCNFCDTYNSPTQ